MMKQKRWVVLVLMVAFSAFILAGCGSEPEKQSSVSPEELEGELIIYHAGSLSIPFEAIEKEFETIHPQLDIQRTSGGSRDISRKVSELGDKVDILVSADYTVIDALLIPDYAKWNAWFAKNSMVIMYTDKSKFADEIKSENWYEILLKEGVNYGHSDPDADPCGYRAVLLWQLAEDYYNQEGLYKKLTDACPVNNIRPKSVELIAMMEAGTLDYAFEYESVARQHALKNPDFKWVELPDEINLSAVEQTEYYKKSSIELKGKEPGEIITKKGEPIVYSLTMPTTGQNQKAAVEFLMFLFDKEKGMKMLEDNGQPVLDKINITGDKEAVPEELKKIF